MKFGTLKREFVELLVDLPSAAVA